MDCMVNSKENYKFDLGVKGLKSHVCFKMHRNCEEKQIIDHQLKLKGKKKKKKKKKKFHYWKKSEYIPYLC